MNLENAGETGEIARGDALEALAFLDQEEVLRLAALCREERFAAGDCLWEAEAASDWMGFVLAGKVAVKKASSFPGRFTLLAEIEAGGLVGEGGMVTGEPRGSTVVALTDVRLLNLSRGAFLRLCAEDPSLALKLLTRIVKVVRHRLHSAGARLSWIL